MKICIQMTKKEKENASTIIDELNSVDETFASSEECFANKKLKAKIGTLMVSNNDRMTQLEINFEPAFVCEVMEGCKTFLSLAIQFGKNIAGLFEKFTKKFESWMPTEWEGRVSALYKAENNETNDGIILAHEEDNDIVVDSDIDLEFALKLVREFEDKGVEYAFIEIADKVFYELESDQAIAMLAKNQFNK